MSRPSHADIDAWGDHFPWGKEEQVEQDLLLSRMLIAIYEDDFLCDCLAFRGGTALHKIHLTRPRRYSEDIDLVMGGRGDPLPIISQLNEVLQPVVGRPTAKSGPSGFQLFFSPSSLVSDVKLNIKVDLTIQRKLHFDEAEFITFAVDNSWFSGETDLHAYSLEETLASKLQALIRRNQLRDMYDLDWALADRDDLDIDRVIALAPQYAALNMHYLNRHTAERIMFEKFAAISRDDFIALADIQEIMPSEESVLYKTDSFKRAFARVFLGIVSNLGGRAWHRTEAMVKELDLASAFLEADEELQQRRLHKLQLQQKESLDVSNSM